MDIQLPETSEPMVAVVYWDSKGHVAIASKLDDYNGIDKAPLLEAVTKQRK